MNEQATTRLLACLSKGDSSVKDELIRRIYDSLTLRARAIARGADLPMVETGVLVNEVYLKLDRLVAGEFASRTHFLAAASVCMRNLCKDIARSEIQRAKRQQAIARTEACADPEPADQLLQFENAIDKLGAARPQYDRIVEMKFYADMTYQQIGEALGISADMVKKAWHFAKSFLAVELRNSGCGASGGRTTSPAVGDKLQQRDYK